MELYHIITFLIVISALFSYINYKFLKLPTTIGLMIIALVVSLLLNVIGEVFPPVILNAKESISKIDFSLFLMEMILSFLLFAGALHVNMKELREQKLPILIFATVGIIVSAFIISFIMFYLLQWIGLPLPYIYCLLFGALISPTDPIAVLSVLKKAGIPPNMEAKISGESLFNDGIGIVLFLSILQIIRGGEQEIQTMEIVLLLGTELIGGIAFGVLIGFTGFWLLKSIDNYKVEVLLTLAMVMGGYVAAQELHLSGPLAVVVAGLITGTKTRQMAMSETTEKYLDKFWELIDDSLNAILFVLIGFEILILTYRTGYMMAGIIAIPVVLLARFIAVGTPVTLIKSKYNFMPYTISILTWGGLRGGISVALALSLSLSPERDLLVYITYIVVIFSIIVQGLTIGKLVDKAKRKMIE